jgi:transcriptional regulator with XRE-family HTH domain
MTRPIVVPHVVNATEMVVRASQSLQLLNADLAELCGVSVRTVSRWWSHESTPDFHVFQKLAAAAHLQDPALAADLATAGGVTLEQLGLAAPPPAQPAPVLMLPPAPPPVPTRLLVESVVCSAAEELDAPPRAVRGILRAAFRRAREMRLSVEDMDDALSPPPVAAPPPGDPAKHAAPSKRKPRSSAQGGDG